MRELENLGNSFESKSNSEVVLTNCSLLSALSFIRHFLKKFSSLVKTLPFLSIKVLFKEKYLSFCINTPTYWSIEFKSIFSQTNSKLMLFLQNNQSNTILIKESKTSPFNDKTPLPFKF
jgi:hypothetical protein